MHLAVCLGATLTASHVYMVNVWDAGLDYVMDFQGFLGAVMVALILAISRPRASYYAAFSSLLVGSCDSPSIRGVNLRGRSFLIWRGGFFE